MAQFVGKYLHTQRLELAFTKIDMQEELEQSILCKNYNTMI